MTNVELLQQKIEKSGLKKDFIAKCLGVSRTTFYNKVNGLSQFNQFEIAKLCELLKIKSKQEKESIFFSET